jgi:hypothetical protein
MVGIGSQLQEKAGPLPVWAWAGLGTVGLAGYLIARKKKAMDTVAQTGTDNTSTVIGGPSTLIPTASPMPYSQGDTIVDTTINNLPPGGATKVTPPTKPLPSSKPTLPAVNPAASPAKIAKNSAEGKTMIKVGCFDAGGHYTGHQVSGHAPVYALVGAFFDQGAPVKAKGAHCIYVPAKFKAYIVGG